MALLVLASSSSSISAEEISMPGASYVPAASAVMPAAMSGTDGAEVYRIGANDVLEITVWQSPDLNRTVTVRFDGRITFPLAGELVAAGLTPQVLAAVISVRLREFIG
ncbi:MAG: polysaccharide biosynthesis/export family protein, partial [Candidatus Hydrogenedentota bacterium]